jgi:Family of unknown function (DUF6093)
MVSLAAAVTARSLDLAGHLAREYGQGAMNALITLTRLGSYDEVSREYDESATEVIYDNFSEPGAGAIAGVANTSGPINMDLGDEPQYYSSVTVYLPVDGPTKRPRVDDIVHIVAHHEDDIVNRHFRVVDVPVGGRIYSSMTLQCVGIAPSRQWQP